VILLLYANECGAAGLTSERKSYWEGLARLPGAARSEGMRRSNLLRYEAARAPARDKREPCRLAAGSPSMKQCERTGTGPSHPSATSLNRIVCQ
jgi:hypothetical protein